jgi:predicted nucleic acid-binding protein
VSLFVVDASVAAKWVLPGPDEPQKQQALHFLRQWRDGEILFVVPDFFWVESANILWKAILRGRCNRKQAEEAMTALREHRIPTVPSINLLDSALDKAVTHGRTVYDSIYVALAVESKAQFVTADEKLVNALASHLPVKWLGAL